MRWILITLAIVVLGTIAWFWYPRILPENKTDPYTLIPHDAWMVMDLNHRKDFEQITHSASGWKALVFFEELISAVTLLQTDQDYVLFLFGEPHEKNIGIISRSEKVHKKLSFDFKLQQQIDDYYLFAEKKTDASYLDLSELEDFRQGNDDPGLHFLIKPKFMLEAAFHNYAPLIKTLLIERFNETDWLMVESDDVNGVFNLNGISNSANDKSKNTPTKSVNASILMRYMPSLSAISAIEVNDSTAIAMTYAPYIISDTSQDNNLFVFVEYQDESQISFSFNEVYQDVPMTIGPMDLKPFGYELVWSNNAFAAKLSDRTVVFAANFEQLSKLIDDFLADDKLTTSPHFTPLENRVSEAEFTLFVRPELLEIDNPYIRTISTPDSINAIIFQQFTEVSSKAFHSVSILHHKEIKDLAPLAWNVRLDTLIAAGPWLFKNHYTNEPEFLIEDAGHELYLINKDGKVLWEKKLSGIIKGDIQVIDAFSNNKLQLVFCTTDKLYFIDRNGKNISGFPVRIGAKTKVEPLCVKYSGKSDYRFIYADGEKLKNVDPEGNFVKGWNEPTISKGLASSVEYVYHNGKDYLIAPNNDHAIQVFDRTGQTRLSSIATDSLVKRLQLTKGRSLAETMFTGYDTIGNIHLYPLSGKAQKDNILPLGGDVGLKVTENRSYQYISSKQDRIIALDEHRDVTLDFLMPESIAPDLQPIFYQNRKWVGLNSSESDNFYLLNLEGRLLDKMPVTGSGKAVVVNLSNNSGTALIIGDGKQILNAYKLFE
ncbi:MAG: hypothetical protein WEC59_12200 [Salibacteraceae bacterium]